MYKCRNKDVQHLLQCNSVVGQSRQSRDNRCILCKNNCFSFVSIAIWPLALGRALDSRSNTTWVGSLCGFYLPLTCGGQTTLWLHYSTQQTNNICPKGLWSSRCNKKLGMIDVKKMCWLQKFDVCDILSRVSTPFLRVNSQETTQASQS